VTPASRPDVFSTLGHAYSFVGDPRRAADLFERCLTELKRLAPDDAASRVRFSSYLSYALTDLGNLRRANEVVEDALEISNEAADPYTRVRLYWSLGRIAYEQSQPQTALEHFRRAVALLEATEDTIHLARAYLSCAAAAFASTGDVADVRRQVEHAVGLLGPRPADADLAIVRWLEAMLATRAGDAMRGCELAREAQRLAGDVPNQHALATWALADALTVANDPTADQAWRDATSALEKVGTVREHAESLRGYARYLRAMSRESEALDVLDRAAGLAGTPSNDSASADR
jgi:tetratricopeptide (TPR) repeat protein